MNPERQRRLEAKGWRFGSAADFLGLTPAERAYLDLRLRLAAGLRALRLKRRMTQMALAELVESSQSRIAKMETGNPTVSLDLLIRSLLALGASRRDLARLFVAPRRRHVA
jgi:DNA-binding XRE family transcriptional regulator